MANTFLDTKIGISKSIAENRMLMDLAISIETARSNSHGLVLESILLLLCRKQTEMNNELIKKTVK